jgi:Icc protein
MRIAHVSDFHLPANPNKKLNGVLPHAHLAAAVEALKRQVPKPDLIILGGDLFEDGDKASYGTLEEAFGELQVPMHVVIGNHDSLANLKSSSLVPQDPSYPGYGSFDQHKLHFVLLNTSTTGKGFGQLEEEQLLWLSEDLFESRLKPVLIFMHHPPLDTGVSWLDKIKLLNAAAFWEIVPPYAGNLIGVFAAHAHVQLTCTYRGLSAACCPAVSWQFSANTDSAKAAVSDELPGFNLIDVEERNLRVRTVRFAPPTAGEAASAAAAQASQGQKLS